MPPESSSIQIKGLPVCNSEEMRRVEKLAFQKGRSEEELMENAGKQIALFAEQFLVKKRVFPFIYLLVGKGNNGGDAYVAGRYLLEKGFTVIAYQLGDLEDSSTLNKENRALFTQKGGQVVHISKKEDVIIDKNRLVIDGLLGTGFKGELNSLFAEVIEITNRSKCKILSIDIPSGLSEKEKGSIKADVTLCLGLPKAEVFTSFGYDKAGKIICLDIGFTHEDLEETKGKFFLLDEEGVFSLLPKIKRVRHKYSAGYVIGLAGSAGMEGAAKLSSLAALRTGAGIVKLFTSPEMNMEDAPFELVLLDRTKHSDDIVETINRAKAFFIGPGLGRDEIEEGLFLDLIPRIDIPCVIDADGLYFLSQHEKIALPTHTILTPHRKELQRLLGLEFFPDEKELFFLCQNYVEKKQVVLVLKGAPTFLFAPNIKPVVIPKGDPGLATAGTGDVLTGVISALLSQGLSTYDAALLGVYLQALSSEIAAKEKTSYSMIASDVIACLPEAIKDTQRSRI